MAIDYLNFSRRLPFMLCVSVALASCGGESGPPGGPPPVGVGVAEVLSRSITDWDEFTGRLQAVDSVTIQPRVSGYLQAVHFVEGALVEKGDLLFTIDDREYQANAAAQRADLARARARVALARKNLARAEKLVAAKAVSSEELEQNRAELQQAEADVQSADAALARAALDVDFTRIKAPIAGRVGAALIEPGNLVTPAQSALTTLVSIDPIQVVFEGDERIYLKYQAQAAEGTRPSSRDTRNPVHIGLASDDDYPYHGEMDFVDNQVDPATGTIQGRAVIDNPNGYLIPGLFARVRLLGSGQYEALLIHEMAVLTDQDRKYVYVVGDDNQALRRDVTLGREVDGLRVVTSGLAAGERIVVNGVRKIFFSGAPVTPELVAMDAPTAAPEAAGD